MIDYLAQFKTLALTALFNPLFLVLLLILFFAGKFVGKLTRNLNIWKILLIAYCGLFLYAPVRDAGPFIGGVFLLGIASNHIGSFFSVFGWAQNLGDVIYAFRYLSAYEDIRRRERDLEEREQRLREEERKRAYAEREQSQQKTGWQQEAKDFRKKARPGQSTGEKSNDNNRYKGYQAQGVELEGNTKSSCLQVLGLKPGQKYSSKEIRQAYRRKARVSHPDAGGSQAEFIEVVNAYEWLRTHII